jgi:MFS transporter, NNP family, nitrate/nitrite transporter
MLTVPRESSMPSAQSFPWLRTAVVLVAVTVGLGLNLRAWILLSPHLYSRFDIWAGEYVALMGLPLVVAAVVRLPVGVLTDRYGARVMFPAVSLAAAAAVFGLGLAGSLPAAVAAGAATGLGGAAFVVGTALVARTFPYGRRGTALGVFSLGTAVAVVIAYVSRDDPGGQADTFVVGGALVGAAVVTGLVIRDPVAGHRAGSPVRRGLEMIRLASTTSLSLLYGLALGGVVAIAVYLPVYLTEVVGLSASRTFVTTAAVVTLGAVARLVGGWWTDRRPTARLVMFCYAVGAGLCVVAAAQPMLWWLTVPVIAAIAACYGLASGALLALIGKVVRADSAGAVMGVTGAVAALGALVPPMLLAGADHLSYSYSTAWTLLAAIFAGVALYVRGHGLRIGLGMAVHFEPEPSPTATTVAVVGESDTELGAAPVVARLAELAASDELVVVYGSDASPRPRLNTNVLVTGLRNRLPRHNVVAVPVDLRAGTVGPFAALLGEFVESGSVAIAVTPTADQREVAAELSSYLKADRLLKVSYTPAAGVDLHEVWTRRSPATNGG